MKKLFLLLALYSCSVFSYNNLMEAIVQSNYTEVCALLENTVLSSEERAAYLELADNIILSRRVNTNFDWIKQFTFKNTLAGAFLIAVAMHDILLAQKQKSFLQLNPTNKIITSETIRLNEVTSFWCGLTGLLLFSKGLYDGACYKSDLHTNLEAAEKIKYVLTMA